MKQVIVTSYDNLRQKCHYINLEERSKEESPVSSRVPLRRQLSRKYSYREKSPKYDTIQDNISRADFVLQVNRKFYTSHGGAIYDISHGGAK